MKTINYIRSCLLSRAINRGRHTTTTRRRGSMLDASHCMHRTHAQSLTVSSCSAAARRVSTAVAQGVGADTVIALYVSPSESLCWTAYACIHVCVSVYVCSDVRAVLLSAYTHTLTITYKRICANKPTVWNSLRTAIIPKISIQVDRNSYR